MSNELTLNFAAGQSLSTEEIDCTGADKPIGLIFAAGYNTTNCTFAMFDQGGNEYSIQDLLGNELELTVSQTVAKYFPLDPAIFAGINKMKVRRGTQATPHSTAIENSIIKIIRREY